MSLTLFLSTTALATPGAGPPPRNVVLVIADDLGVDKVGVYAAEDFPEYAEAAADTVPRTPTLDGLAEVGVRFTQAWSNPTCSPSRAALFTGRHGFRTGVGEPVGGERRPVLPLEEVTIAEVIGEATASQPGYATGFFGKWHLGAAEDRPGELTDDTPGEQGFDTFQGVLAGSLPSFYEFEKVVDGVWLEEPVTDYATFDTIDDTLAWIDEQSGPWMATVSLQAPHAATGEHLYEPPPASCLDAEISPDADDILLYRALVECLDAELETLLSGIAPDALANTTFLFIGDNGTVLDVRDPDFEGRGAKNTTFEGGVHVPLIIVDGHHLVDGEARRGPPSAGQVRGPGRTVDEPVHVVDLFATIAEIAGREGETGIDSTSLAPLLASRTARLARAAIFTESFIPAGRGATRTVNGDIALRDGRYKLRASANWMADPCTGEFTYTSHDLYDLAADPFETYDLLHEELDSWASAGYDRLYGVMTTLHQSLIADLCETAP